MNLKGLLYNLIIDPLLAGIRASIVAKTGQGGKIIDIACGTGTLAIELALKNIGVTALDLDSDLIAFATKKAAARGITNILFETRDASDLSMYEDQRFDIAVTSMSVHQFEAELAVKILKEMKRIARKIIIADYNHPLPDNISGKAARGIEWLAGGEHYRNFANFMKEEGLKYFTGQAGLQIRSSHTRGNGVFLVYVCK